MEIVFSTKKLRDRCNDQQLGQRSWGLQRATLVSRRLQQLLASPNLAVFMTTPGRPHQLRGNRSLQFTVDLDGPYRLVFTPAEDPPPMDEKSNTLIYEQVTSVCIQGVEDTHE